MMMQSVLYESLRQKRNELAKQKDVKPFMVLHNKVLQEIAREKPTTLEKLAKVKGMGPKKIAKYGKFILEAINSLSSNATPKTSEEKVFSVGEFIDFLNQILVPQKAIVQGEVGEVKPRNNYTFFKLLDKKEEAVLSCFVWNDRLSRFGIKLKEGLELKVGGYPKLVKSKGYFSFEVEHIGLVGEGALKIAFEELKKKLAAAGFFAPERKKEILPYVEKIGLITSAFADAKTDFLTHLGKFGFKIHFCDVRVEGLYAIDDITSAIRWFNENMLDVEVLVLTRGGGSLENLQAFNSEAVAKAIFGSKIPIITGIGHERDETIADLVADIYASTPTDAARILSDPWRDARFLVTNYEENISSIFTKNCANIGGKLVTFEESFISSFDKFLRLEFEKIRSLQKELNFLFQRVFEIFRKSESTFSHNLEKLEDRISQIFLEVGNTENSIKRETKRWLKSLRECISQIEERLKLADPTYRLKQGYSIVFNKTKQIIKSTKQIKIGESLNLRFYEGSATSRVEKIDS